MVVTCQIDFDNNPLGIYFAGQVLSGKVTLTADKPKEVRAISLRISGYCHTHWSESESRTVRDTHGKSTTVSESIHYSGREDYLASLTYLLGSKAAQTQIIAPGIHSYNFACHLPITCPSSFEGSYGHIRYLTKIALVRPWKFDQTFTKGFTVLKVMNLNYESPLLRMPTNNEVQKVFCCGPCRSDPLKIEVNLTQTGFVPGQNIPITLTITNDSRVPVEEIKISLMMLVCYYSQTPRTHCKNSTLTIAKLKGEGVMRQCKKQYFYELPVPATPPTCFNLCRLLQVAYQLNVEAKVKGMHASQVIGVPVTIGNVPLTMTMMTEGGGGFVGVIQQQPMMMMQRNLLDNVATSSNGAISGVDGGGSVVGDIEVVDMKNMKGMQNVGTNEAIELQRESLRVPWSNADANILPPSYEEAIHVPRACINADEKHDYGEVDFAPRYPVFHMTTAATAPIEGADEIDGSGGGGSGNANNGTWL